MEPHIWRVQTESKFFEYRFYGNIITSKGTNTFMLIQIANLNRY